MGAKPTKQRSDLQKGRPEKKPKAKERSAAYLRYQRYIKSKAWKTIRDEVLLERGERCQFCGRKAGEDGVTLTVHHNTYDHLYNEQEHKEDLIVLCNVCHLAGHKNKNNYKRFKLPDHDTTTNN